MKSITPLEKYEELGKAIGFADLYFKREDKHPYGSHKGRSIPVMIDHYIGMGASNFAISSSGNAALAAALYIRELSAVKTLHLDIFVGNHISREKLSKLKGLEAENIRVLTKERPLQGLTQAVQEGATSLRQSTDDIALIGYESLAKELDMDVGRLPPMNIGIRHAKGHPEKIGAIFIGTSSGTTAQALANHFLEKGDRNIPQMHIIQTSSCHPIVDAFENFDVPEEKSIADAIVDQTAMRKPKLIDLIPKTGGRGWCVTNESILATQALVRKHTKLEISTNSALSVVGVMQASYLGHEIDGAVICMICGD